ncbi:hypothetical protein N0V90_009240 [Kalmusia sp. IMI 367209]|nr:hypothetical protein N0V90_009240 [Kalmusia sp. IMI 367209]
MSRITLGSNDLLEYNPDYGVLICRDCEYAIQKSAVQSHLLRHKIYRGERQNLLSSIAQFDLREPDSVRVPDPDTRPIAALPVLDGYCCLQDGCSNLCASVKRMRRHWADVHGGTEDFEMMAREVKMQTFFRGTKIRYFEVCPEAEDDVADQDDVTSEEELIEESEEQTSDTQESDNNELSDPDESDEEMEDTESANAASPNTLGKPSPTSFDLETLKSFHKFLSTTRITLPSPSFEASNQCYWHTTVLALAFSRHWMMSGLLAMTEYHTLALTDDEVLREVHRERAVHFFAGFVAGREEASRHVCGAILTSEKEEERRVGGQMMCILRCAHWAFMEPMLGQGFTSFPFQLQNFLTALRSFSLAERSGSDGTADEIFARASQIFKNRVASAGLAQNDRSVALFDRLDRLPSLMTDVFGRPDNVRDVMATLSAIAILVEHYSFSSNAKSTEVSSSTAVWHSMVQWLSKAPEHFRHMVSRHDPAALVVVAHWASALVLRAEQAGYWFLRGLAHKLIHEIEGRLRSVDDTACSLLEGLLP